MTPLLTGEDLMKRYRCHKNTLRKWRRRLGLPHIKIGTTIYYDPQKLREWEERYSIVRD